MPAPPSDDPVAWTATPPPRVSQVASDPSSQATVAATEVSLGEDPYQTPGADVVVFEATPPYVLASPARRLTALNLDILLAAVIALPLGALTRLLPLPESLPGALALGVFLSYSLFKDALPGGQSLAKRLLSMTVVSVSAQAPCSPAQSLVRNAFLVLGPLDAISILFGTHRRAGDFIAGTEVRVRTKAA